MKTLFGQFEEMGGLLQEIHHHLKSSNPKLEVVVCIVGVVEDVY